jgi:hypothetical protein
MSSTVAQVVAMCRRDIRDEVAAQYTFTDAQVQDMIGEGIEQLTSFYAKEVISTISATANVYSYSLTATNSRPFRVDVCNSNGTLAYDDLDESNGEGTGGGWVYHGGTIYTPEWLTFSTGQTLKVWGYGPWFYIDSSSASSATVDLDQSALSAVRKWVQFTLYSHLANERARFAQNQQYPESNDVGPIALLQYRSAAKDDWERAKTRLTRMQKIG